jgi:hypothetical protein
MSRPLEAAHDMQKHSAKSGFYQFPFHKSPRSWALAFRLLPIWVSTFFMPIGRSQRVTLTLRRKTGFFCKASGFEPTHQWTLPLGKQPSGKKMKERM